jgi:hypothetical protein
VAVGVADVVAADAGAPIDGALDGEIVSLEAAFPGVDVLPRDGKGDVDLASSVMREDAVSISGFGTGGISRGGALAEEEEHLVVADFERGEAVVGFWLSADQGEVEELAVEGDGAGEVRHIQGRLEDSGDVGCGGCVGRTSRAYCSCWVGHTSAVSRIGSPAAPAIWTGANGEDPMAKSAK